jgi:aminopeptidase N
MLPTSWRNARLLVPITIVLLLSANGLAGAAAAKRSTSQNSGGRLMKEQAAYDVQQYDLSLRIDPVKKFIWGTGMVEVILLDPLGWLVLDLDPRLKVKSVRLPKSQIPGGKPETRFERRGAHLWIPLGRTLPVGERVVAAIDYEGRPCEAVNAPWDGGFTWSKTKTGQPWVATSVQGQGADLWWPCKDHPSDKPESFTLRIRVPKGLVVAANGRLIEVVLHEDGARTYHWHTAFPISNYNVALNIAPYETLTTNYTSVTGDVVPATYWVLPENKAKGEKLLPEMLAHLNFYERLLGPYPFRGEKYGVAETPHLGMEHQSIIAYGNKYNGGPHGYDWLHHHELGHEWWGNLVTVEDWRHFWIHEGLCTYMQALYAEEREGSMAYHHALYEDRRRIRNRHALVPEKPTGIEEMDRNAGNDVYYKGAWVVHMLRYLIGRDQTLMVLRRFAYPKPELERLTDGSVCRFVSTADFVRQAEEISGRQLDWFFDLYLNQPKLPKLVSEIRDDQLLLRWETPPGYVFPLPVEIEVDGQVERIEMPGGQAELSAARYGRGKLDPQMWILKESRLIEIEPAGRSASPAVSTD